MTTPQLTKLLSIICAIATLPCSSAPAAPRKAEIAAAGAWFDRLSWPDLRAKPYVEIAYDLEPIFDESGGAFKYRGFLVGEDETSYWLWSDGSFWHDGSHPQPGWPFVVEHLDKSNEGFSVKEPVARKRELDLAVAVDELIAHLHRPANPSDRPRPSFGRKTSQATAVFVLSRICAWQGRAGLVARLEAELLNPDSLGGSTAKDAAGKFRRSIEQEIAHALMWKAVVDFGNTAVSRPELLGQFKRIAREFPQSEHHEQAVSMAETLRGMFAEDEAHARTARPLEAMNDDDKIRELIFRLRDQNGRQFMQPGDCDIFADDSLPSHETSPADQLVKLGFKAVPALIDALDDPRLSRSVGYHRDFFFSHEVLTVGDCAEATIARIASRHFWDGPNLMSTVMPKERDKQATHAAIHEWWNGVKDRGETAMLSEGTRAGGLDSPDQAKRLVALDPAAALPAIAAGIEAAKSSWARCGLVSAIAEIKSEEATQALRREMEQCACREARVDAGRALLDRGEKDVMPALIAEWMNWDDAPRSEPRHDDGDIRTLIAFLGWCGDPAALQALAARFAKVRIDIRINILRSQAGAESLEGREKKPPRSPAIEALQEDLLVSALTDREVYRMSGNRQGVPFRDPRVCDYAAMSLADRWPERYSFQWRTEPAGRDEEIAQMQSAWRDARGQ